jgi:hypothetical protein
MQEVHIERGDQKNRGLGQHRPKQEVLSRKIKQKGLRLWLKQ